MKKSLSFTALLVAPALLLSACGSDATDSDTTASAEGITLVNCDEEVTYANTDSWYVNDGNIISMALSAGAIDHIDYVSQLSKDIDILRAKYGDVVDTLNEPSKEIPSLEEIVSKQPDIYVAGWNYGMTSSNNVNPDTLEQQGISTYILSESCRQGDTDQRGTMDPWEAADTDLLNLGKLAGTEETAQAVVDDIHQRLAALQAAPSGDETPVGFIFDSGTDSIFTSGSFGAPTAILNAAGSENAMDTIDDTWVSVSWENLVEADPDYIVFVDYPGQSFEEKVEVLKSNPASRDLKAVQEERFINLSYSLWCSSPLNIDAAEWIRVALENYGLLPESGIAPSLSLPENLPGLEYLPNNGQA